MPSGGTAFAWYGFSAVDARTLVGGGYVVSAAASNTHRRDALELTYTSCAIVARLDAAGEMDWYLEQRCQGESQPTRMLLATDRDQRTFVAWQGSPVLQNPQMRSGGKDVSAPSGPLTGRWARLVAISPAGFPMWMNQFVELGDMGASAVPIHVEALDGGGAMVFLSTQQGLVVVGTWGDGKTRFLQRYPGPPREGANAKIAGDSDEHQVCLLGPSDILSVEKDVGGEADLVACFDRKEGRVLDASRVSATRLSSMKDQDPSQNSHATALAIVGKKRVIAASMGTKQLIRLVGEDESVASFDAGEVTSLIAQDDKHVLVALTLTGDVKTQIAGHELTTGNTWPATDLQLVLRVNIEDKKVELIGSMLAERITEKKDETGGTLSVAKLLREPDGQIAMFGTLQGALRIGSERLIGHHGIEDACSQEGEMGKEGCRTRFWGEPTLFGVRWKGVLVYSE